MVAEDDVGSACEFAVEVACPRVEASAVACLHHDRRIVASGAYGVDCLLRDGGPS